MRGDRPAVGCLMPATSIRRSSNPNLRAGRLRLDGRIAEPPTLRELMITSLDPSHRRHLGQAAEG
jgi:hypothetical protein